MIRFLARGLLFSFMALLLASCDSGNDSVDVPGISGYTLTMATVDATTGLVDTQASAAAPLRVVATLTSSTGAAVPGASITFTATGVGRLGTATAQTDGLGVASVILNAGTSSTPGAPSAGVVSVRFLDPNLNMASDSQNYTTMGDEVASGGGGGPTPTNVLRMTISAVDSGNAAISSTNPISTAEPGRLVVLVTLDGVAVPDAFVTFTVPNIASLSQATAATNAAGRAEVTVNALSNGAGVASAVALYGSQQVSGSTVISTAVNATASVVLKLGNGTGAGFVNNTLATSAAGAVALGSTITVSADVVEDPTNVAYGTPVSISFASACAALSPAAAIIDASAATVNGHAVVTYRPTSCADSDVITATLRDGARTLTATTTIDILPPVVNDVSFVSVTPSSGDIALAGTGGLSRPSRADVAFMVTSDTGSPVANQTVCFGLSTSVGGLSVNARTSTNSSGIATATVQAGSVPTSVRVLATVDTDNDNNCATVPVPALTTVSSAMYVSTGLPDQNSFSVSLSTFNPHAWEIDNAEVTVTARAADHFNNPVPQGTAISFWTELGSIDSACLTDGNGTCFVKWRSQSPRSNRDPRSGAVIGVNQTVGRAIADRLGRSTIVAYAVGEESFGDTDGDGRFDDVNGNGVYDFGTDETIGNLPEVIKDSNENGARDVPGLELSVFSDEEFVDFDRDGVADPANTRYDGVLCAAVSNACSGDATVNVRDYGVIVMSSRVPRMYVFAPGTFTASTAYDYAVDGSMTGIPAEISSVGLLTGRQTLEYVVTDINGNSLPSGSTISAEISPSTAGKLSATTPSATVPIQTEFYKGRFTVDAPALGTETDGVLVITVRAGGVDTVAATINIDNVP